MRIQKSVLHNIRASLNEGNFTERSKLSQFDQPPKQCEHAASFVKIKLGKGKLCLHTHTCAYVQKDLCIFRKNANFAEHFFPPPERTYGMGQQAMLLFSYFLFLSAVSALQILSLGNDGITCLCYTTQLYGLLFAVNYFNLANLDYGEKSATFQFFIEDSVITRADLLLTCGQEGFFSNTRKCVYMQDWN